MQISVQNKIAVMKRGTSFQYVCENRNFTGSDSYTFNIVFPLKGCPQNIAIFGHIHRKDVAEGNIHFDAEIRDGNFYKAGVITIMEISESEVKTQFLEGRSAQNYDATFDDIYINQLDLGSFPNVEIANAGSPERLWRVQDPINDYVSLPWVNNATGLLQNEVSYDAATGRYAWVATTGKLSHQAFLIFFAARIFKAVGYTYDLTAWINSPLSYLLVCNTLPAAWEKREMALALPHWSVSEFISELELLLGAEFDIDHKRKFIGMQFTQEANAAIPVVVLDKVIKNFTEEISKESDADYLLTQNLSYTDIGHFLSPYYNCHWFIKNIAKKAKRYDTLAELLKVAKGLQTAGVRTYAAVTQYSRSYRPDSLGHLLFYAQDVDTYFIMFCYQTEYVAENLGHKFYRYYFRLMPVNQFGDRIVDEEEKDVTTLNIVPVPILDTDAAHGRCIFVEPGNFDDVTIETDNAQQTAPHTFFSGTSVDEELTEEYYDGGGIAYSAAGIAIKRGKQESDGEYYSNIFVAFWDGNNYFQGQQPCPLLDRVTIKDDFTTILKPQYNIRINEREAATQSTLAISDKRKYQFSFLSDTIPNPRAIFYIEGIPYVCEKLTATFTERGKSQLIKGVFYRKTH